MSHFETKDELLLTLKEIEKWERDQKGLWFWEKLGRLPFVLLDKLTPKFIHTKIGESIDELGRFVQSGGKYLVNEEKMIKKYFQDDLSEYTLDQVALLKLEKMNSAAQKLGAVRSKAAMVQGGTTGVGGLFTLSIDIPLMLGMTLKTIQEVCICYGYDPQDQQERIFIVKCLQFVSSDIVGKKAILEDLSAFHDERQHAQMMSQLQGWREVLTTYRDQIGWKKLFQMIPIAGILFGAFINKSAIQDTAEAASMLYRKRRANERLRQLDKDATTEQLEAPIVKE